MNQKQYVIFMVTNGAGLGHLTRALAIAKKLNKTYKNIEPIFLTTCIATEIIRKEGFIFFYIPSKSILPSSLDATRWVTMLKDNLENLINIYEPKAIIFEGAYPCGAVLSNLRVYPKIKSVWIKRESNKSNPQCLREIEKLFNLVIVPKESAKYYSSEELNTENKVFTSPIILLDKKEALDREDVRNMYEVRKNELLFYLQLDTKDDINTAYTQDSIIKILLQKRNIKILLAQSIVGETINIDNPRIKVIKDYPNSKYFKGVDFAIAPCGYNTYHELVEFRVPTLFIPNTKTVLDDQIKRAMYIEVKNAGLCYKFNKGLENQIMELVECRDDMKKELEKLESAVGATEVTQYIIDIIGV